MCAGGQSMRLFAFLACMASLTFAHLFADAQVPVGLPAPAPRTPLGPATTVTGSSLQTLASPAMSPGAPITSGFADLQPPISGTAKQPLPSADLPAPTPTLDSLGKKVDALSKGVEELSKNLTVVTGDGDFKLVLGGAIVADFLYNTTRPFASGTPFYLPPEQPTSFDTRTFDAHARQS